MTEKRRGRPPKAQEPKPEGFAMVVTAPWVSIGPRDAVEGEKITVCAQMRKSLLFWGRARDA